MSHRWIFKNAIYALLVFTACKSIENNNRSIYTSSINPTLFVQSSCKISVIKPIPNEELLKQIMVKSAEEAMKKYKLKSSSTLEKSDYTVSKTELIITESCGIKTTNNKIFISFKEVIELENVKTKEKVQFSSDTIPGDRLQLGSKNIVPQKIVIDIYIPSLVQKNYAQIKEYFHKK